MHVNGHAHEKWERERATRLMHFTDHISSPKIHTHTHIVHKAKSEQYEDKLTFLLYVFFPLYIHVYIDSAFCFCHCWCCCCCCSVSFHFIPISISLAFFFFFFVVSLSGYWLKCSCLFHIHFINLAFAFSLSLSPFCLRVSFIQTETFVRGRFHLSNCQMRVLKRTRSSSKYTAQLSRYRFLIYVRRFHLP